MKFRVCLVFGFFILNIQSEETVDDKFENLDFTRWMRRQKRDTHDTVNTHNSNLPAHRTHSTVYQYNEPYGTSGSDGSVSSQSSSRTRPSGNTYSAYYTGRGNEGSSGTIRTVYGSNSDVGGGGGVRYRTERRNLDPRGQTGQTNPHSQSAGTRYRTDRRNLGPRGETERTNPHSGTEQHDPRRRTGQHQTYSGYSTTGTNTDPRYTHHRFDHTAGGGNRRGGHQPGSRRYQTSHQTGHDRRYVPNRGVNSQNSQYIPIHSVSTNTGSGGQAHYIPRGQNRRPGSHPGLGQRRTSRYGDRCPETGISVTVNGRICWDAVAEWPFVCYRYENMTQECCDACMERKNPSRTGCEYGDKSVQCRHIKAFECYYARNEEICCETCANFERRGRPRDCRFGDKANNCERVRENPGLCYQPIYEQRCCETCPMVRDEQTPGCEWGDHYESLCEPFDDQNRIRLDCYNPYIARLCCSTCQRLKQRMPTNNPACEYGDHPVRFQIPQTGQILDCYNLVQQTRGQACTREDVSTNCCFTCRGRHQ